MYLENAQVYYEGTSQCVSRGLFLILCQPPGVEGCSYPMKAFVRKVAMKQLGQFMMGFVRIHGEVFSISGTYGCDGLTMSVPMHIYDKGILVPQYLVDMWNKGGGWNSAGGEASEMRKWGLSIAYQSLGITTHIKAPGTTGVPVCNQLSYNNKFADVGKATCKNCIKYFPIKYPKEAERCRGGVAEVLEILDKELNK